MGIVILILQVGLIALSVLLAHVLQSSVDFIPKAIISLPEVDYTTDDLRVVLVYFTVVHTLIFLVLQSIYGRWIPSSPASTCNKLYSLAGGFSLSALLVFTTTSVAYDPNFVVGIAVVSALLFAAVGLLAATISGKGLLPYSVQLIPAIIRKAITPLGITVLIFALSPGVLAKLFVSDRDVANVITQVRIFFSGSNDSDYSFVAALNGRTFSQPMLIRLSPWDKSRIYILERAGRLVSVDYPGGENYQVDLDIRNKVGPAESENGALGFSFPPGSGADTKKQVYLYYTMVSGDEQANRLSRFELDTGSPEAASESELPLMQLPRENSGFHNGGSVEFGPDGYLYLAIGEGVHPKGILSQQETLRSGILRVDIDCQNKKESISIPRQPANGHTANYCIPNDNPFVSTGEVMAEYWALGLRNPFRISFDHFNGDLWAGDVGSTKWEEVNLIEKAGNYQFPWIEGNEATEIPRPDAVAGNEIGPKYTYVHTAYDRAVIGGLVYRGPRFPRLDGKYLFADNYSSKLFSMSISGNEPVVEHIATADQFAQRGTSSVNTLPNGDILVTTLGRSAVASGEVLRLLLSDEKAALPADSGPAEKPTPAAYSQNEINSLYVINCARCHGTQGDGLGPDAPAMNVEMPDFSDSSFQSSRTDEELIQVIREGGFALGMSPMMPAWGHILNDEEIQGLVEWIRSK